MLIYGVTNLPDITLSKYQAVEESGIESMLEAQTRLIRQLYRFTPLYNFFIKKYRTGLSDV